MKSAAGILRLRILDCGLRIYLNAESGNLTIADFGLRIADLFECAGGNDLKWEVGMRKWENVEFGSRNGEVGKKEGKKIGSGFNWCEICGIT